MAAMVPTRPFSAVVPSPGGLLAALIFRKRERNLFLLLLDQEFLHRILLVMVQNQFLKLLLLLEHRSTILFVGVAVPSPAIASAIIPILFALGNSRIAHQPCNIISFFLIVTPLVPCVIHTQQTP
jgi:hypothetical protein